jgi:hypothetical protein
MPQKDKPHGRQVYEDFAGGDYGVTHPRRAGANQFQGKNVIVYRDGTLGPRNGLVVQPLSGSNYVNGALNAFFFGVEHDVATPRMIYAQGTRPKHFKAEDLSAQNPGLFSPTDVDVAPSNGQFGVMPRLGFNMYLSSLGDGTYQIDALGDTMTKLTGTNALGAHDVVEYLDFLFLIGVGDAASGRGHKVTYSDHADPTSWPIANIFAVGYAWVVFRALKLINGLLIINQDADWYLLQGDVDTGSLRRLEHGRAPDLGNPRAVVPARERAWFLATGAPGGSFPAVFDGSKIDTDNFHHLRGWMTDANAAAVHCEADDDLLFVDNDGKALMRHEGVFTRHQYEVAVGEWAAPYVDQRFYLAVDGTVSTKPVFYRSTFAITGPPIKDGLFESPGDGSDTPIDAWVEFPELWQSTGEQVRPMFAIVEFTSYDQNVATGAHLAVEVDVIDRFGKESVQTVSLGDWDESEATVASTTDGVRRRKIFRGATSAAHFGSALQLRIKDIIGVKIEKAVLDFEIAEQLDRA